MLHRNSAGTYKIVHQPSRYNYTVFLTLFHDHYNLLVPREGIIDLLLLLLVIILIAFLLGQEKKDDTQSMHLVGDNLVTLVHGGIYISGDTAFRVILINYMLLL